MSVISLQLAPRFYGNTTHLVNQVLYGENYPNPIFVTNYRKTLIDDVLCRFNSLFCHERHLEGNSSGNI
jgi:hypothetical protein